MDLKKSRRRWTTFYSRNLSSSISLHGDNELKLRFRQRNRKGGKFGRFKPGYFMYIGPGSEKTWNSEEKYPDVKGKWDELENKLRTCILDRGIKS